MKASRSELTAEQQKLVEDHMWLAVAIAKRIAKRVPPRVLLEDLISAGYLGLVECAPRFDGRRAFKSFAGFRIQGAILDWMRGEDLLTRQERQVIGSAIERKEVPIDPQAHAVPDSRQHVRQLDAAIDTRRLLAKLRTLCPRRAFVLEQYDLEGRKLKQIGADLGVGEARAGQLRSDAIVKLRAAA